jgi:acetoacetyl-CoA synthetase
MAKLLWQPSAKTREICDLSHFSNSLADKYRPPFQTYEDLYHWSVTSRADFWREIWEYFAVVGSKTNDILNSPDDMFASRWFPGATLNYAENLLRLGGWQDEQTAMVFWGENKVKRKMTHRQMCDTTSRLAQALRNAGVEKGDRVAGYLSNMPEAICAMLATASLGAIWSSASPDFGVQGVVDRFGQIEPKVLFAVDGYWYNGKKIDCREKLREITGQLKSIQRTVIVPYLEASSAEGSFESFIAEFKPEPLTFAPVEFSHPLFILYSSGTTGVPKCIVHGHGGTLLQHLKEHRLHGDIKSGDRLFYFTTLGWMMWNWLASALASGATLLLYDGSPFLEGQKQILFDFAESEKCTHFGTSAKYLDAASKNGLSPIRTHRLSDLRVIFSTGSPLSPEGFDYVYEEIKSDVNLSSISGGTDIISCFVLGNPLLPVYRGEIQCRGLGMAVKVFNEDGRPVVGEKGELVCTRSFPSQPVGFWRDADGQKYRDAYFSRFPSVWCHGDYVELTERGGVIIYGRSDAVLNPGGVRIGTAEIYRQVERQEEVLESIVIGQDWQNDVRVILFVKLKDGLNLTAELIDQIKQTIRQNTTPRHVPAKILQVEDIPRTKSGKIVELAVRNIIHGQAVKNKEALANPEALEYFRDRPELKT